MTRSPITLEIISGFGAARARGALDVLSCSITTSIDGNEALTARVALPSRVSFVQRTCLRATDAQGVITDWRISNVDSRDVASQPFADITAGPPLHDLATGGVIRRVVSGRPTTRFIATGTLAEHLQQQVLADLPVPLNAWLDTTLGTMEAGDVRTFELDGLTRLEYLRVLEEAYNRELHLERQSDHRHRIAMPLRRNESVPALRTHGLFNVLKDQRSAPDQNVVSVVVPLGETATESETTPSIAENVWTITSIDAAGWAVLRNHDESASPVAFNGQWYGFGLVWDAGNGILARCTIVDSRVSDGAVRVSSTAGLSSGRMVTITLTPTGDPLAEVVNPDLITSDVGRVEQKLIVAGGRGERNYLSNPRFRNGAQGWTLANAVPVARSALGVDRSIAANGSRAANTGTGTPLAVDGLTPGEVLYAGDQLRIGGFELTITADALADSAGRLTVTVGSPGLPSDLPMGTPMTLVRRRQRSMQVDGTQSAVGFGLKVKAIDTDHLPESISGQWPARTVALTVNSVAMVGHDGVSGASTIGILEVSGAAGKKRLYTPSPGTGFGYGHYLRPQSPAPGTFVVARCVRNGTVDIPTSTVSVNWTDDDLYQLALMTAGTSRLCLLDQSLSIRRADGTTRTASHVTIVYSGASGNVVTGTLDASMLDAGDTVIAMTNGGGGIGTVVWSDATWSDGQTVATTEVIESRVFTLATDHTAGATSIAFGAVPSIAKRDAVAGDAVYLRRFISATLRVTGVSSVQATDLDSEGVERTYWTHTISFDAGASTLDDLPSGDYIGQAIAIGGVQVVIASALSSPLVVVSPFALTLTTPVTLPIEYWKTDVYTVSSGATWNANGTLTIPISVPSGRAYPYGAQVWTNWHQPPVWQGSDYVFSRTGLMLAADVTGSASSIIVEGTDTLLGKTAFGADIAAPQLCPVYRITGSSGSTIPVQGENLYVAATVTANGSGEADVTLRAPNTLAVANNATIIVSRPALVTGGEPTDGNLVRLLGPDWTGTPSIIRGGAAFLDIAGVGRICTARAWSLVYDAGPITGTVTLEIWSGTPDAPIAKLSSVVTSAVTPLTNAQLLTLATQATLTANGYYHLAVVGTGSHLRNAWYTLSKAMLTLSDSVDVPFTNDAHANAMLVAGNDYLVANQTARRAVTLTVAQVETATGRTVPLAAQQPGVSVLLEESGETLRVQRVTRDLFRPELTTLQLDTILPTIARLVGTGASASTGSTSVATQSSSTTVAAASAVAAVGADGFRVDNVRRIAFADAHVREGASGVADVRIHAAKTFRVSDSAFYVPPTLATPFPDNTNALQAAINAASAWVLANDDGKAYYDIYAKADVEWATWGYFDDSLLTGTYTALENTDWVTPVHGQRVLVKDHADPKKNGIYVVNSGGAWTRATDADSSGEFWLSGTNVRVASGHQHANTRWRLVGGYGSITLGTTDLLWRGIPLSLRATVVDDGEMIAISRPIDVGEGVDLALAGKIVPVPGSARMEEMVRFRMNSRASAPFRLSGADSGVPTHGGVRITHWNPDQRMVFAPMQLEGLGARGGGARNPLAAPGASDRPLHGVHCKGYPFDFHGAWVAGGDVCFRIESSDIDGRALYALGGGDGAWLQVGNSDLEFACDTIAGVPVRIDASSASRIVARVINSGAAHILETGSIINQSWAASTGLDVQLVLGGSVNPTRVLALKWLDGPSMIRVVGDVATGTLVRWGDGCTERVLIDAVLESAATPVAFDTGITTGGLVRFTQAGAQKAAKKDGTLVTVVAA